MAIWRPPFADILSWVAGVEWPDGNEDQMWDMAHDLEAVAAEVRELMQDVEALVDATDAAYPAGVGSENMLAWLAQFRGGEGTLAGLAESYDGLAESADSLGTQLQSAKLNFHAGLVWFIGEMAVAAAMGPGGPLYQLAVIKLGRQFFTKVAATAVQNIARIGGRFMARKGFQNVARIAPFLAYQTIQESLVEVLQGTSQEYLIQRYQVADGHLDSVDMSKVWTNAKISAVAGAAGGLTGGLLHHKIPDARAGLPGMIKGAGIGATAGLAGAGAAVGATGLLTGQWEFDPRMFTSGALSGMGPGVIHGRHGDSAPTAPTARPAPTGDGSTQQTSPPPSPPPPAPPSTDTSSNGSGQSNTTGTTPDSTGNGSAQPATDTPVESGAGVAPESTPSASVQTGTNTSAPPESGTGSTVESPAPAASATSTTDGSTAVTESGTATVESAAPTVESTSPPVESIATSVEPVSPPVESVEPSVPASSTTEATVDSDDSSIAGESSTGSPSVDSAPISDSTAALETGSPSEQSSTPTSDLTTPAGNEPTTLAATTEPTGTVDTQPTQTPTTNAAPSTSATFAAPTTAATSTTGPSVAAAAPRSTTAATPNVATDTAVPRSTTPMRPMAVPEPGAQHAHRTTDTAANQPRAAAAEHLPANTDAPVQAKPTTPVRITPDRTADTTGDRAAVTVAATPPEHTRPATPTPTARPTSPVDSDGATPHRPPEAAAAKPSLRERFAAWWAPVPIDTTAATRSGTASAVGDVRSDARPTNQPDPADGNTCARDALEFLRDHTGNATIRPPAGRLGMNGLSAGELEAAAGAQLQRATDHASIAEELLRLGHGASALVVDEYAGPVDKYGIGAHAYTLTNDNGRIIVHDRLLTEGQLPHRDWAPAPDTAATYTIIFDSNGVALHPQTVGPTADKPSSQIGGKVRGPDGKPYRFEPTASSTGDGSSRSQYEDVRYIENHDTDRKHIEGPAPAAQPPNINPSQFTQGTNTYPQESQAKPAENTGTAPALHANDKFTQGTNTYPQESQAKPAENTGTAPALHPNDKFTAGTKDHPRDNSHVIGVEKPSQPEQKNQPNQTKQSNQPTPPRRPEPGVNLYRVQGQTPTGAPVPAVPERDTLPPPTGMQRGGDGLLHRPKDPQQTYRTRADGKLHHLTDPAGTFRDKNFDLHDKKGFTHDHLKDDHLTYKAQIGPDMPYPVKDPRIQQELNDRKDLRAQQQVDRDQAGRLVRSHMPEFNIKEIHELKAGELAKVIEREEAKILGDQALGVEARQAKLERLYEMQDNAQVYNRIGPEMVDTSKKMAELGGQAWRTDPNERPNAVTLTPFDGSWDGNKVFDGSIFEFRTDTNPSTLTFVEEKGLGSELGGAMTDTGLAEQGSPEYAARTAAIDQNLARILKETPEQMRQRGVDPTSKEGQRLIAAKEELLRAYHDGTLNIEYVRIHANRDGTIEVAKFSMERDGERVPILVLGGIERVRVPEHVLSREMEKALAQAIERDRDAILRGLPADHREVVQRIGQLAERERVRDPRAEQFYQQVRESIDQVRQAAADGAPLAQISGELTQARQQLDAAQQLDLQRRLEAALREYDLGSHHAAIEQLLALQVREQDLGLTAQLQSADQKLVSAGVEQALEYREPDKKLRAQYIQHTVEQAQRLERTLAEGRQPDMAQLQRDYAQLQQVLQVEHDSEARAIEALGLGPEHARLVGETIEADRARTLGDASDTMGRQLSQHATERALDARQPHQQERAVFLEQAMEQAQQVEQMLARGIEPDFDQVRYGRDVMQQAMESERAIEARVIEPFALADEHARLVSQALEADRARTYGPALETFSRETQRQEHNRIVAHTPGLEITPQAARTFDFRTYEMCREIEPVDFVQDKQAYVYQPPGRPPVEVPLRSAAVRMAEAIKAIERGMSPNQAEANFLLNTAQAQLALEAVREPPGHAPQVLGLGREAEPARGRSRERGG